MRHATAMKAALAALLVTRSVGAAPVAAERSVATADAALQGGREQALEIEGGLVWGLERWESGGKVSTWGFSTEQVEDLIERDFQAGADAGRQDKLHQVACRWTAIDCQCDQEPGTSTLNCLWAPGAEVEDLQYDCMWSEMPSSHTGLGDRGLHSLELPAGPESYDVALSMVEDFIDARNDSYVNTGTFHNLSMPQVAALLRSNYISPGRVHVGVDEGLVFNLADTPNSDFGAVDVPLGRMADAAFSGFSEFGVGSQVYAPGVFLGDGGVSIHEGERGFEFEFIYDDERTTTSFAARAEDDEELDPNAEVDINYTCRWESDQMLQCKTTGRRVTLQRTS